MAKFEIDQNEPIRCCRDCSIFRNSQQTFHYKKIEENGDTYYVTRIEPCETIWEISKFIDAGNPACKISLIDSVDRKRN